MIPGLPQLGVSELLIILFLILLLFGAKRIPELARSLGRGTREFREAIAEAGDDNTQDHDKDRKDFPQTDEVVASEKNGNTARTTF